MLFDRGPSARILSRRISLFCPTLKKLEGHTAFGVWVGGCGVRVYVCMYVCMYVCLYVCVTRSVSFVTFEP